MDEIRRIPAHLAGIAIVACLLAVSGASAQQPKSDLWEGDPALAKVSSHLLRARALAAADRSVVEIAAAVPSLRLRGGLPEVAIRLESLTPALVEELRGRGLIIDGFHLGYARAYGRLDPANLDEIAAVPEVVTIQPMPRRGTRVGAVTSQADATMKSEVVRDTFGYDGTGVTVGILSDSFNKTTLGGTVSGGACTCATSGSSCATVVTGMTNQDSLDLPPSIPILDDCTVGGSCTGLTDEGAAIGELIYDAAPGAGFMFHSAVNNPADFADGITQLVNCGADLIVDDIFWPGQAFFQDDIIAQAAQAAVDAGVPYFSAAGNRATFGVHDTYTDSTPASPDDPCTFPGKALPNGNDLHDFGGGDLFAAITMPEGCDIYAELQWAEPFQSIGSPGPGSPSDLDLFLLDSPVDPASTLGANIIDSSVTRQGCGFGGGPAAGDPVEFVSDLNAGSGPKTVFLAVDHCCGDESVEFRIVNINLICPPGTFPPPFAPWDFEDGEVGESTIFVDPQIFGHPAAKDVVAVAAAFYGEIDAGGDLDPPYGGQLDVEPFSSLGGDLPFYFDENGDPLPSAPVTRFKPEVTGPDGVNNTFFPAGPFADDPFDPDLDPNFFGTSAAATNSAAIGVLILDATDLKINPLPLKQLLSQGALDMEQVEQPGIDDLSGSGFTDARWPIRSLDSSTTPFIEELEFDLDGGDFFKSPPTGGLQRVQAISKITFGDGDFSGVEARAAQLIFADGFESGDTSAWGAPPP